MEDRNALSNPAHLDPRRVQPFAEFFDQGRRFGGVSRAAKQPIAQRSIEGSRNIGGEDGRRPAFDLLSAQNFLPERPCRFRPSSDGSQSALVVASVQHAAISL
jgi:hypothetical protein